MWNSVERKRMKTEIWNGYEIRFVENEGKWFAVANDICKALAIRNSRDAINKLPGVAKTDIRSGGEE